MIAITQTPVDLPAKPGVQPLLDKEVVDQLRLAYSHAIPVFQDCDPRLAQVIVYSLDTEGSFIRAQLAYAAMRAVEADESKAVTFGVAVELFHTASLLIDDLPCMDDASHRRGRVCPHVRYGEADAMLAALSLIHHAYDEIFSLLDGSDAEVSAAARRHLTRCLGVQGILSGQCADIHFEDSARNGKAIAAIAAGKTGTLLNLVLGFPAILQGADAATVSNLERLAGHWGVSYQILDDFKDMMEAPEESGKTAQRDQQLDRPNMVFREGPSSAWYRLNGELMDAGISIDRLSSARPSWMALKPLQDQLTRSAEALMDRIHL